MASWDNARTRTSSMRRCRSRDHTANGTSLCIDAAFRLERFQHALFQDQDLLLRILECRLAIGEKLGTPLVGGQRFLERQLPALHRGNDFFELGERGLKTCRRFGDRSHENGKDAVDCSCRRKSTLAKQGSLTLSLVVLRRTFCA